MQTKESSRPYPAALRERAVRLVREHSGEYGPQGAANRSIAEKVGRNAETLRLRVRRVERDRGERGGPTTDERQRMKSLERENSEPRRANEILRKDGGALGYRQVYRLGLTGIAQPSPCRAQATVSATEAFRRRTSKLPRIR